MGNDGGSRTLSGIDGGTANFFITVGNRSDIIVHFALNADVEAVDGLGGTNEETNHRIVFEEIPSETTATVGSTIGRIVEVNLILVGFIVVSIFGSSFAVAEIDDGVVGVRM